MKLKHIKKARILSLAVGFISLLLQDVQANSLSSFEPIPYQCSGYHDGQIDWQGSMISFFSQKNQRNIFSDREATKNYFKEALDIYVEKCKNIRNFNIKYLNLRIIDKPTNIVIYNAEANLYNTQWKINIKFSIGQVEAHEQQALQVQMANKARAEAVATEQKTALERKQKIQEIIKSCNGVPKISGGPWIGSSSYKEEVMRLAKSRTIKPDDDSAFIGFSKIFLCIDSIEYIKDAPNPMGVRAARINIVGIHFETLQQNTIESEVAY